MVENYLLTALIKLNTMQGSKQPSSDTWWSVTSSVGLYLVSRASTKFTKVTTKSLETKRENSI